MATDLSEAEPVHHKALPLLTGAQLIHTDKLSEKVEEDTMPIRRSVNSSSRETPPKSKPAEGEEVKADTEVTSEESASVGEEQENETLPAASSEAEQPKEPENEGKGETKSSEETKKDEKDQSKEKEKKVKKTIPAWATLSASQLARAQKQTQMAATSRPKMDAILTEAIRACFQKSGASVVAIRKYIIHKYPSLELERRGYLLKQALKRELERGIIRQVKGKGASGSFVVVSNAGKTVPKARDRKKSTSASTAEQQVKLEDILPLAFTRLCEPKEASYSLIKKYVSQYYPKLKVDIRPQLLKNALQRAVEKGQLEQITGKGASGTFQLKKSGEKPLLGGTLMEDAILSAIAAMNEPKTCSTTALKKYILENHPGTNSNFQVHLLKRTLQKCEKNGWMEQISGKGFSGTFQLCFPYYPSPDVLYPEKQQDEDSDESDEEEEEESDEEEESEEEESEEEEPPPKKRMQKRPPPKSQSRAPPMKRRESKPKPRKTPAARRGKAKPPPKVKTPAKKAKPAAPAIKKPSGGSSSKKPAASGRKEVKPSAKGKATMRKSLRAKK
ncbi:heterochromatin protein 1-binding protein 3 isoform X1 [Egretta garzetta]|uniref:Heterochromatin protein 1-binding protein 3 n=1 Tax=Egretta garzetta TaxID=188379 RepID=A0A091JQW3_EGRGA|nr:heterochromatin protein 1-binding protein 3 isoform X1 [Egretta garzetta]XP_035757709.1 heterochromatin protein 1-binding protein 3 isoform X1 [Egretta garzetta]KFP22348.1 Heterochromatin protein 1-binding protein 3 [Egretta garzetta]